MVANHRRTFILEPHHLRLLQLACEAWDQCQTARAVLETEGLTVQNEPASATSLHRDRTQRRLTCARLVRELDLDTEPPVSARLVRLACSPTEAAICP